MRKFGRFAISLGLVSAFLVLASVGCSENPGERTTRIGTLEALLAEPLPTKTPHPDPRFELALVIMGADKIPFDISQTKLDTLCPGTLRFKDHFSEANATRGSLLLVRWDCFGSRGGLIDKAICTYDLIDEPGIGCEVVQFNGNVQNCYPIRITEWECS